MPDRNGDERALSLRRWHVAIGMAVLLVVAHIAGVFHERFGSICEDARAHLKNGDAVNARILMERAVDWQPGSAQRRFGLGEVYYAEGDVQRAVEALERGFLIDPWNRTRVVLGDVDGMRLAVAVVRGHDPTCAESAVPAWTVTARLRGGETVDAGDMKTSWDTAICIHELHQP